MPARAAKPKSATIDVRAEIAARLYLMSQLATLIEGLGAPSTAKLLAVRLPQLRRITTGKEGAAVELSRRIVDLGVVYARASRVLDNERIREWLTQPEPLLGTRTPITVLATHGPATVIGALDARLT